MRWTRSCASRGLRTRWANDPRRQQLAGLLDDLERHLDGWFFKYGRFQQGERARALVYLADEDKLGPRFPTRIDAAVKELVAAGSATTRGRD